MILVDIQVPVLDKIFDFIKLVIFEYLEAFVAQSARASDF